VKWIPCVLLAVYALLTWQRIHVWSSEKALWSDAASKAPCLARPHWRLSLVAAQEGNADLARAEESAAIQRTLMACGK
jgi:hypothetical protein